MIHRTWCENSTSTTGSDEEEGCYSRAIEFGSARAEYDGARPALWLADDDGETGVRANVPDDLTLGELDELATAIGEVRALAALPHPRPATT